MTDQLPQTDTMASLEKKLDLLLRTGQLLMQSGADSNRIDRNVRRVAAFLNISSDKLHMHITFTTLMISITDDGKSLTHLRKNSGHGVNMTTVSAISKLSWRALEEHFTLEQYEKELEAIPKIGHHYPRWLILLAVGLACGGFCVLFGCDWQAMIMTSIAASTGLFVRQEMHKRYINNYMTVAVSALIATLISCAFSFLNFSGTPHHIILASVLYLIPGVPLINSLDDMIDGFTIIGLTRAVIGFFIVIAIAFGMILAFRILNVQDYSVQFVRPHNIGLVALAAAVAATGFAILFNVPVRTLILCALGGAIAVVTRNLLLDQGYSLPVSAFSGAFVMGLCAIFWVHKVHTPGHVISIPPVIPMVPGVLAFKAMIGLITFTAAKEPAEQLTSLIQMFEPGIESTLTILGISLGVAIPNIIDRYFSVKVKERRMFNARVR